VLVVCGPDDLNVALSFRNLDDCHPILMTELNAYDVLVSDVVLFTKATLPNTLPATPVAVAPTGDQA
jgi:large subunit ribosomal protein L4